jgi:hypothetical protein
MAAERDHTGEAGAGLSGPGRGADPLHGGASDPSPMGDRGVGGAAVGGGLGSGPGAGAERYEGLGFASQETADEVGRRARGAAEAAREHADTLTERARHAAEELGHQAGDVASAARDRLGDLRERANDLLERRGIIDRMRENPLPVIGVAFALGFLLAGNDGRGTSSRGARARRELRNALAAGLSAGLAQGARSFFNEAGSEGGGFVNSLLENFLGEHDDDAPPPRASREAAGPGGTRARGGRPSHLESY